MNKKWEYLSYEWKPFEKKLTHINHIHKQYSAHASGTLFRYLLCIEMSPNEIMWHNRTNISDAFKSRNDLMTRQDKKFISKWSISYLPTWVFASFISYEVTHWVGILTLCIFVFVVNGKWKVWSYFVNYLCGFNLKHVYSTPTIEERICVQLWRHRKSITKDCYVFMNQWNSNICLFRVTFTLK